VDADSDRDGNGAVDGDDERGRAPGTPFSWASPAFERAAHGQAVVDTGVAGGTFTAWAPMRTADGHVDAVVGAAFAAAPLDRARLAGRAAGGGLGVLLGVVTTLADARRRDRRHSHARNQDLRDRLAAADSARRAAQGAADEARSRLERLVAGLRVPAAVRHGDRLVPNAAFAAVVGPDVQTPAAWFDAGFGAHARVARALYEADRAEGFPEPRTIPVTDAAGRVHVLQWVASANGGDELWLLPEVGPGPEARAAG
jgi:hypothetical protein